MSGHNININNKSFMDKFLNIIQMSSSLMRIMKTKDIMRMIREETTSIMGSTIVVILHYRRSYLNGKTIVVFLKNTSHNLYRRWFKKTLRFGHHFEDKNSIRPPRGTRRIHPVLLSYYPWRICWMAHDWNTNAYQILFLF